MAKLWGGRFKADLHETAKKFSYSLGTDHELLCSEIQVSVVHAMMLGKSKIISKRDTKLIVSGLKAVYETLKKQNICDVVTEFEDVHTLIQSALEKRIGVVAKKLHTGRSRNDLVVTSTKLYLREKTNTIIEAINRFQCVLTAQAERNFNILIPGYTHLQRAQVISIGHHLLAYVEMLERDKERLLDAKNRFNECPLGAGALSGTSLNIDRAYVAKQLGFKRASRNSLDSVSDRDFVLEILSGISILMMHLSRFSEDMILWTSQEFGYATLDDQFSTGSSLMPHKKNPDMFELVRGKTGEAYGNLVSLLVTMKGLPLAYNRDMQEDKRPLFASLRLAESALLILEGAVKTLRFEKDVCLRASKDSFLFATDVLEYLVKRSVPFRQAHDIVGNLVKQALDSNQTLSGLSLEEYQNYSKKFKKDVFDLFDPEASVKAKMSLGSTNPERVKNEIFTWKAKLKEEAARFKKSRRLSF